MLSFFKRKNKQESFEKQGSDTTVSSQALLNEEDGGSAETNVETTLSIHPDWNISEEEKYVFQFLNNDLPPLKPNQVSLSGIELTKDEHGGVVVTAFVRNSLSKAIAFKQTPLLLMGENDEQYARKAFELQAAGELPATSSRPWSFQFAANDLLTDPANIPATGWKLAFELTPERRPHELDLADSWQKTLAEEDKQKLTEMVKNIEPPKPGEVNFMGLQATIKEENLHVTILIRNGSDKNVQLEQLPLLVEDATGQVIAQGGFQLEDFEVKANTSKPWTFIFPQSLITKETETIDLSRWKAYPKQ